MQRKPSYCYNCCSHASTGVGFVSDEVGQHARIAIVLERPGKDELIYGRPLIGKAGKFFQKELIDSLGYRRDQILIANTLRCGDSQNKYPVGKARKEAEEACRHYDDKLQAFNGTVYVATFHPALLLRQVNATKLVKRDLEKAFRLADQGERPVVLMGQVPLGVFAPHLRGGIKRWRGHVWRIL